MAAQQQLLLLLFSHTQDYLSESDSMVALHDQVRDVCLSVCIFACCMCVLVCAQAWEHVCVCVCVRVCVCVHERSTCSHFLSSPPT